MGRTNTPTLSGEQRLELEKNMKNGATHAFRNRCHSILPKAGGRDSKDTGRIVGLSHVSVNGWLKRYGQAGIEGLKTRPGRGRKRKLDQTADAGPVRQLVQTHRQNLRAAKAEWEAQSGTKVGLTTLKAFLKSLADDTDA